MCILIEKVKGEGVKNFMKDIKRKQMWFLSFFFLFALMLQKEISYADATNNALDYWDANYNEIDKFCYANQFKIGETDYFYTCTRAKKAESNTRFKTLGYTIAVKISDTVDAVCQLKINPDKVADGGDVVSTKERTDKDGVERVYTLWRIPLDKIYRRFQQTMDDGGSVEKADFITKSVG